MEAVESLDMVKLEKEFLQRGYSFGIFEDPPGQQWLDFVHSVDELLVVLEGDLVVVIDGIHCYPEVGEEVFIPANSNHDVITGPNSGSRWAYGYRHQD
ncbi:cupin domain-containing protein [Aliagarivorans marinus]|uniref:cupin domain-containing protein n=1 Tax=Aliagarivorans marinus TaxID=561965 RepID=UPI000412EBFD|nr:cupin domain-containing protein [Aliagarivorans marinus]